MESENEPDKQQEKKEQLITGLKCLLADEYILLNKTSFCLLDDNSPFANNGLKLFQQLVEEVRVNIELVKEILHKQSEKVSLSIDDIISNTQLKKQENYQSKVSAIEVFLDDHFKIIQLIEKLMHYDYLEELDKERLLQIVNSHKDCSNSLNKFLKELFNYRSIKMNNNYS